MDEVKEKVMIRFITISFIVPLLLVGCLGLSKKDSNTKSVKNKHEKRVEMRVPVAPALPALMEFKSWEKDSNSNEKDKSSSTNVSGMFVPALGIGLILCAAGIVALKLALRGFKAKATGGLSELWNSINNMTNYSNIGSETFLAGQKAKGWVELLASKLGINI